MKWDKEFIQKSALKQMGYQDVALAPQRIKIMMKTYYGILSKAVKEKIYVKEVSHLKRDEELLKYMEFGVFVTIGECDIDTASVIEQYVLESLTGVMLGWLFESVKRKTTMDMNKKGYALDSQKVPGRNLDLTYQKALYHRVFSQRHKSVIKINKDNMLTPKNSLSAILTYVECDEVKELSKQLSICPYDEKGCQRDKCPLCPLNINDFRV